MTRRRALRSGATRPLPPLPGTHRRHQPAVTVAAPLSSLQAEVKLRGGSHDGRTVWLEYEDFSRFQGTFK